MQPRSHPAIAFLLFLVAAASPVSADVESLTLNPTTVFGTDPSTGTVVLGSAIGHGTRTVSLFSSNPAVASVPASIDIAFGRTSGMFTVTTSPVAVQTEVVISALHNLTLRQATLTLRPPTLTSIVCTPNPVVGGQDAVATITINRPAPSSWLCTIEAASPVYFSTGSIVAFPSGALSTTKIVNSNPVGVSTTRTVTVRPPSGQSPIASVGLTLDPVAVVSLALDPVAVSAGGMSTGCVMLNAPAPPGGALVTLASADPALAGVPAALAIAAGEDAACFDVTTAALADCASVVISAAFGGRTAEATLAIGATRQLTDNAADNRWNQRHPATNQRMVLWTDGDDVLVSNGGPAALVQERGELEAVEDSVFGLGSGAAPGEVIGGWRRGTDFGWVWRSGAAPVLVQAVNPIDPEQPLNPEALAIADGAVFFALQAFADGNAVKHVFRVDPITGIATNLTGAAAVPGAGRIATAGGQAAWVFDDGSEVQQLQFYDGASVHVVDSGAIFSTAVRIARGRVVYQKESGGVEHIFLYDSTQPGGPVQLTTGADVSRGNFRPATDGYHVAWLAGNADGTALRVELLGGLPFADAADLMINVEHPVQLQRGQLLWRDRLGNLSYAAAGRTETLCLVPAATFADPWMADGVIVGHGPVLLASQTDSEVFWHAGAMPDAAAGPLPPLLLRATADDGSVQLEWDAILGASSYAVYAAEVSGVTPENYAALPGGLRVGGLATPGAVVDGLQNGRSYFFVVTASEGGSESAPSPEAAAVPSAAWRSVGGFDGLAFHALAAHEGDGRTVYAAGNDNVYKSTDGGETWAPLSGAIAGRDTRALAVRADTVFAVTIDGDILRSPNAGADWDVVADGAGFGEQNAAIAVDPSNPQNIYAGDLELSPEAVTLVVRSDDGGDTWSHIPESDAGELHAYALAVDPAGVVYLAGTGVPVARSADGGQTWTDLAPGVFLFYSLALDPLAPTTLYAGSFADGVWRSIDAGAEWTPVNVGLPLTDTGPINAIVADPLHAGALHVGTGAGVFASTDGGETWNARSAGLGPRWVYALAQTRGGRLIAATDSGLYVLASATPADMNCDGAVNFDDIEGFVLALIGQGAYESAYPACAWTNADANGDGAVNFDDLEPFVCCLIAGGCGACD